MSNSAINQSVFSAKIGSVQNQADTSSVYSSGQWSFKNSTAVTSVTITDAGRVGVLATSPRGVLDLNTTREAKIYLGTAGVIGETQSNAGDYIANNLFVSAETAGTMTYTKTTGDSGNAIVQDFSRGIAFYSGVTGAANSTGTLNNFERMRIDANGAFTFQTTQSAGSAKAFLIKNAGETSNGRNTVTLDAGNIGSNSNIISFNKNNGNLWNIFNDTTATNATDFAIWSSSTGGVTLTSSTQTSWSPRSSDERKKKNFETTQGLLEVLQIEPVKYQFNSEDDSSPKRLGFKAQNLQPIIPEMVFPTGEKAEDGSDYLTITPDYLLPVLVKAIQELSAKVDAQAAEIEALKAK